jgi:proteasome lid subunit RPN8/RPN11
VNDDIEFGEVEHAAPVRALRPDENRHFAVASYGTTDENELPIFVDLDVLADMEDHAASDTSVELGGVLLGGTFADDRDQPFVVVTDSLRAQHFESTKGSFKFTHDTWEAITREREAFPADLKMVGWYHTHPDWGVFLSGMDMFICDNFFNKSLDVAYVIDPCRGDRGMFQWTGDERQRVRRTGGFFVTASRFRAMELEHYVAELQSTMPVQTSSRALAGSYPAPVVHLHQPRDEQPQWLQTAVLGLLALQCLLIGLVAWRMLAPPVADSAPDDKVAAALDKLNTSLGTLETRHRAELVEDRAKARAEFLDDAFRELKGSEPGAITRLQSRFDETAKLTEDVAARDSQIRELSGLVQDTRSRLGSLETSGKREEKRLQGQIEELTTENGRLQTDLQKRKAELASLTKSKTAAKGESAAADRARAWWWLAGGIAAVTALIGGVWWIGSQRGGEPVVTSAEEKA